MFKNKMPYLFTVLILATIVAVFYSLTLMDDIVHGSLYDYGLQFSLNWANPYWTTLRIVQVLLGVTAAVTVVNAVYNYWIHNVTALKVPKTIKIAAEPKLGRFEAEPKIEPTKIEPKIIRNEVKPKVEVKKPEVKMNVIERLNGSSHASPTLSTPPNTSSTSTSTMSTIEQQLAGIPPGMVKCGHCGKIFAQPLRMLDFHEDRPRMVSICPFCNEVIQTAPRPA